MLGVIFRFYSNSIRTFCKQTVEALIRRRVPGLHSLPMSLGLYGLINPIICGHSYRILYLNIFIAIHN